MIRGTPSRAGARPTPTLPTTILGTTSDPARLVKIETARLARLQAQAPALRAMLDRLDPWTRRRPAPWSADDIATLRALLRAVED